MHGTCELNSQTSVKYVKISNYLNISDKNTECFGYLVCTKIPLPYCQYNVCCFLNDRLIYKNKW